MSKGIYSDAGNATIASEPANPIQDEQMSDARTQRYEDALSSLVDNLVPSLEIDDDATADERHDNALDLARHILEDHGNSSVAPDVHHAADLIKKKLIRENSSAEKAARFSNLYPRLLSQPVLSNKWEILYLLYQLADNAKSPAVKTEVEGPDYVVNGSHKASLRPADFDDQTYKDAFATSGLPRLPNEQERPRSSAYVERPHLRPARAVSQSAAKAPVEDMTVTASITPPSDSMILRDLPFVLQGLSTTHFVFQADNTLRIPPNLPIPTTSLLYTLAEPALLYRALCHFVEARDESLIGQSLRSAIQSELRSYLALISSLETHIRQSVGQSGDQASQKDNSKIGVTLKRCVLWTREPTLGLRLMSLINNEAMAKKGGQLISVIHKFSTSHGNEFVSNFAERLLSHVTRPFYEMLRRWIYDGELTDPYQEFFVVERVKVADDSDPRRAAAKSVWEDKYVQDETMIPSIITANFARKVFLIGKSLNFIRYSCGDSAWVESYSKEASQELRYGDTAALESSIDQAYTTTMARLTHLMDTKFQLFEHLLALKRYLLLGQGDFIALLMESLSPHLDRPAGSQYRHTLTSQLEHAIRGSNAQFDSPDRLRRLDARLTEIEKGDTGWDVFTLEYKVDAPVDVIITPWANTQYLKIFNLLWRVKRVEFALGSTWRRCMTGARGVLASVDSKTSSDWKRARCSIAEMIHFIDQLQYYILFEVIEASWEALHKAISRSDCTLDDLIQAHSKYLRSITHKGLLGSFRTTSSGHKEDIFTVQLHEILKLMLHYKDAVDGLYSYSVAEFTRKQELAAKLETRTAHGKFGVAATKDEDDLNSPSPVVASKGKGALRDSETGSPFPLSTNPLAALPPDEESMLPALRTRLNTLSADFKSKINNLLGDLSVQPDVDMKFLAVVMNFNDVYQPKKRRRHGATGATTATDKKTPGLVGPTPAVAGTTRKEAALPAEVRRIGSTAGASGKNSVVGKGKEGRK